MEATLFFRSGTPFTGQPSGDPAKPSITRPRVCGRCAGEGGAEQWRHTGWTCFRCDGAGTSGSEVVRLYTAGQLAKLNATAAKRAATKQARADAAEHVRRAEADAGRAAFEAEHAEILAWLRGQPDARTEGGYAESFLGSVLRQADTKARLSEGQLAGLAKVRDARAGHAAKTAGSRHVGAIGERITANVVVERLRSSERPARCGWGAPDVTWIIAMRDDAGNALSTFSTGFYALEGARLTIRGTVKEHTAFRGERQTTLSRVAKVEPKAPRPRRGAKAPGSLAVPAECPA